MMGLWIMVDSGLKYGHVLVSMLDSLGCTILSTIQITIYIHIFSGVVGVLRELTPAKTSVFEQVFQDPESHEDQFFHPSHDGTLWHLRVPWSADGMDQALRIIGPSNQGV